MLSQPATISDVSDAVFGELLGSFADTTLGSPETEIGKLASKVAKSTIKSSGKEAYQLIFQRMINDLTGDTNLAEAFRNVEKFNGKDFPILKTAEVASFKTAATTVVKSKEYTNHLKEYPPAMADNPTDAVDLKSGVEKFRAKYDPKKTSVVNEFDAFALYDDIYPGQRSTTESIKAKLVAELSPAETKTVNLNTQADFVRSRSFADLFGHSNTGGVLIGRAPEEVGRAMGFVDLQWVTKDNGVLLILKRKDRQEFSLGPYKPSLVHQALAYVADGRAAAVTILNVDENGYQKIFLHPAFLDTQLGRDIIELDQFVFDVMEGDVSYEEADQRVIRQQMLYLVAWLSRALAIHLDWIRSIQSNLVKARALESLGYDNQDNIKSLREDLREITEKVGLLRRELGNAPRNQLAARALAKPGDLLDSGRSILAFKKEFFDQDFVKDIKDCAETGGNLVNFNSCVEGVTRTAMTVATDDKITKWLTSPPDVESLSGVRETPFTVDADLYFLKPPTGQAVQLWPLDFMIIRAFSSSPEFLPAGQDPATYADRNPWQFGELRTEIASKVWQRIDSDSRIKTSYQDLRDFTVLQRLFRLALEGDAWSEFPIEKLVTLTESTAGSYVFVPTARWHHSKYGSRKPELFEP